MPAVGRHQDLGAEARSGKAGRERRYRLPRRQAPGRRVVVEEHDGGALLLDRVQPPAIRMEREVPRSVSGWQRHGRRVVRRQEPFSSSNVQTKILSRPRSACSTRRPGGSVLMMCACVRSWPLIAKLPGGACVALVGPIVPAVDLDVRRLPQPPVRQHRNHRDGPAEVVGHQQVSPAGMHADVCRPGAAGTHRVEQLQASVGTVDGEGADAALIVVPDAIGLVGGVETRARRVEGEATRARAHLDDARRRHGPGGAIDPKKMDAAAVSGREIHLGRQRAAQRRAEGADIRDQGRRGAPPARLILECRRGGTAGHRR